MATIKGWFTMNGMHIPIMEGQSKAEAAQKYINSKHGKTVARLSAKTKTKLNKKEKPTSEEVIKNIKKNVEHRTSKDNQKNNKRIQEYLDKEYPEYNISFTNFKADGDVIIHNIETKAEFKNRIEKIKESNSKTKLEEAKFKYRITPTSEYDRIELKYNERPSGKQITQLENLNKRENNLIDSMNKKGHHLVYEQSKSSFDASYISVSDKNDVYIDTIRVGNHFKPGVSGQYKYNIAISEYKSKKAILKDLEDMINQVETSVNFKYKRKIKVGNEWTYEYEDK